MTTDRAHQLAAIRAWSEANKRSRHAYYADQAAAETRCPGCGSPAGGIRGRWCSPCRRKGRNKA